MGQVIQFKPRDPEETREREPSRVPTDDTVDAPVVVLAPWSLVLAGRILDSLQLTYWYWCGNEMAMVFLFDPWAAKYLKHPAADRNLWSRMHAVFFPHFCQNMRVELRMPLVVKRFLKSELIDRRELRIFFETIWWVGKKVDGEPVPEDFWGNRSPENAELFECQFMLKTKE